MLRTYKACPRKFELEYIELLKPVNAPVYLTVGSNYHSCVESILKGWPYEAEGVVASMARAFDRFIPWREWEIAHIEQQFDVTLTSFAHMIGKMDALCADGTPVEHKTTSSSIDEKYINNLAWDDQISFYLLARTLITGKPATRVIYTVCQKPTIKLKQNETEEQYLARVEDWYTDEKVKAIECVRSASELKETEEEVRYIVREIRNCKHFYRNPRNCSMVPCPYASICLNYDPELTTGFVKKERESEELDPCKF